MLNVDLDKFWEADEIAHIDNCFNKDATQVALGIRMSEECVFSELGVEGQPWLSTEREKRINFNRRYNDIAEKIVGKRLLNDYTEKYVVPLPETKKIGEIFGGEYLNNGHSIWLHSDIDTPEKLEKQLDIIDKMDFEDFILPKNWEKEKKRYFEECGKRPSTYNSVRGPVTLATSILGVENFIFMFMDEPELVERMSKTVLDVIMKYIDLFERESQTKTNGFGFFDDDCALMTPDMYETFGYPILKAVFERTSPNKDDRRYQHSDSDMGHLLPILSKLNLTGCNFGPTLTVEQIRKHMPNTRIDGQLAPFTFMRNNQEDIIAEVKRDCQMAINGGFKGLNILTAGSINNGSSLESMRSVMWAIQEYGQY